MTSGKVLLWSAVCAAFLTRLYFVVTTPVFDNDSMVVFILAKRFIETGVITPNLPLGTFLVGVGIKIFGEHILVGRLVQLAAAILTVFFTYKLGKKLFDRKTGALAAFLLAFIPLHIFYSTIANVYALLTFLFLMHVYFLLEGRRKQKAIYLVFGAACLFLAVLCKTLVMVAIVPTAALFFLEAQNRKKRSGPTAATAKMLAWPVLVFCILALFLVVWRIKIFGEGEISWRVLNDAPIDYVAEIIRLYVPRPWEGLMKYNSITPFVVWPLLYFFLANHRPRLGFESRFLWWIILSNIFVVVFNPMNHNTRGLLPSVPLLAILSASGLAGLLKDADKKPASLAKLGSLCLLALVNLFSVFGVSSEILPPAYWILNMDSLQNILLSVALMVVGFLAFSLVLEKGFALFAESGKARISAKVLIVPFLAAHVIFGVTLCRQAIRRHADNFFPLYAAVSFSGSDRVLGGEDLAKLISENSHARVSDLPREDVVEILRGGLNEVLRKHGLDTIIQPNLPDEREELTLRGIAEEENVAFTDLRSSLYGNARVNRVYDNGRAAVYRYLDSTDPADFDTERRLKRYRVPYPRTAGMSEVYFSSAVFAGRDEPEPGDMTLIIANKHDLPRQYAIRAIAASFLAEGYHEQPRAGRLLWEKTVMAAPQSPAEIDIKFPRAPKTRLFMRVEDLNDGETFFVYCQG